MKWFPPTPIAMLAGLSLLAGCKPGGGPGGARSASSLEAKPALAVKEATPFRLPEKVSFNEHIQPILSEKCYHCHGPDAGTRAPKEAPLRLDVESEAFAMREDGKPVILRGNPKESALLRRMRETDPDLVMPPPESHKKMEPREIALIDRWIEQGA